MLYVAFVLIADFLLKARRAGLGHEAVIEIMIALLGVMVAVLAFIGFIMSVGLAVIGWFGFQSIKDEATKSARAVATRTATEVSTRIATRTLEESRERAQASELSETQAEDLPEKPAPSTKSQRPRVKATSDKGLSDQGT